jgi:polyisoprenoid-binding protein YceI
MRGLACALLLTATLSARADALLIDTAQSEAGFAVRALWIKRIDGSFGRVEGVIERDAAAGRLDVDVRIDAASVRMDKDSHADWARSADFFDAARHPWIRFRADAVPEQVLRDGGQIQGELTLRGITRPIAFALEPGECARPGFDCQVRALGEVQRSEFGMDARRFVLGDKVRLEFALRAHDPAAPPPAAEKP